MKKYFIIIALLTVGCGSSFNNQLAEESIKKELFSDSAITDYNLDNILDSTRYKIQKINSLSIIKVEEVTEIQDSIETKNMLEGWNKMVEMDIKSIVTELNTRAEFPRLQSETPTAVLKKNKEILDNYKKYYTNRASAISEKLFNKSIPDRLSYYDVTYRLNIQTQDGENKVFDTLYTTLDKNMNRDLRANPHYPIDLETR